MNRTILKVALIIMFALAGQGSYAQDSLRLLPGDPVPESTLMLDNYVHKAVKISDLKGKLVIFAMWDTSEGSEYYSQSYWPKLNELQRKYKDDIQIILVNNTSPKELARRYFTDMKRKISLNLPVIYSNKSLNEQFPLGRGMVVWIDQEGHFKTTTLTDAVVDENIEAALAYRAINRKINDGPKMTGLKPGDVVPNYTFTNLINYPAKSAKLSDFKGKLVILDFWSTSCLSCIASWPKLLKLQEKFKDKIQIILVNSYQDEAIVRGQFAKSKRLTNLEMDLPTICRDTVLGETLFPHSGVPHVVWINAKGIVQSITGGMELTGENIAAVLKDEKVYLRQKVNNDDYISFDTWRPLFVNGNGNRDRNNLNVLWQSIITKGIPELYPVWHIRSSRFHGMINSVNRDIRDLYALAYSDQVQENKVIRHLPYNRIQLIVKDSSRYIAKIGDSDNRFVYQLLSSRHVPQQQLQKRMQLDLMGNFGLDARWEVVRKKCLVLAASDTSLISYTKGPFRFQVSSNYSLDINKVSARQLADRLTDVYISSPYPIINEIDYDGLLGGIKADADVSNYKSLDKALRKYGMRFTLEERPVKVLVLREPEGYTFPFPDNNVY